MKKIIISLFLCVLAFIVIWTVFDRNIEVEDTFSGLYFDPVDPSSNENIELKVIGYGRKSLFGHYEFEGKIDFNGKQFNVFYESGQENIVTASDDGLVITVGRVYINSQFNEFIIYFLQNGDNYKVGEVLVFPCDSLQQAIEIMDEYDIDNVN